MAKPATVPGAHCKTSLASAYGLAADSYPAFSLPLSPLLSTLLIDINSDLSKFMEDQTVHGFLPRARSPTTEVLRHLHLLFSWTLHGPAWLDLHYHGES